MSWQRCLLALINRDYDLKSSSLTPVIYAYTHIVVLATYSRLCLTNIRRLHKLPHYLVCIPSEVR